MIGNGKIKENNRNNSCYCGLSCPSSSWSASAGGCGGVGGLVPAVTSSCQGCCSTGRQLPFPSSVVDLRLRPRTSWPKLRQPPLWFHSFIHSGSSVSGPCNPWQSTPIHERPAVQLFFMRGRREIIGTPRNSLRAGEHITATRKER